MTVQKDQSLHGLRLGFIGTGNLCQALVKGLIQSQTFRVDELFGFNRSPRKLAKLSDQGLLTACKSSEEVLERANFIFLAVKPQDLFDALDPLRSSFGEEHYVCSLAAGVSLSKLRKSLPTVSRIIRLMPSTAMETRKGVIGLSLESPDEGFELRMKTLFEPLGRLVSVREGDELEALTVACASGVGFVFELMLYWKEWLEEYGFDSVTSEQMAKETFLAAASLAHQSQGGDLEGLLKKVTSKKGVTQAGLESMRELEVERALRYSFEKAILRDQEIGRST